MSDDQPVYLGDGVYSSFDGYQIWLHLGEHTAPGLIALDQHTLKALVEYGKRLGFPV